MDIAGSICLVTGANRGVGRALAAGLVAAGAATVYAGARDPEGIDVAGVVPIRLDITDPAQVAAAAERCADVTLLFNNAGVMGRTLPISAPSLDETRQEMETNFFGTLAMCRAFAPVLARNGGGAIVNQLSIVSWFSPLPSGTYSASKAAEWSVTNAIRTELRPQGTLVMGVHCSFVDTDMAASVTGFPKISADELVARILDGVRDDAEEVLADSRTREVKALLPNDLAALYPHS